MADFVRRERSDSTNEEGEERSVYIEIVEGNSDKEDSSSKIEGSDHEGLADALREIPDALGEIPDALGEIPDALGEIPDALGEKLEDAEVPTSPAVPRKSRKRFDTGFSIGRTPVPTKPLEKIQTLGSRERTQTYYIRSKSCFNQTPLIVILGAILIITSVVLITAFLATRHPRSVNLLRTSLTMRTLNAVATF